MWPLLTFGWELFLQACLEDEFTRVMEEFAEINRRVFRAFARLPVNWVLCHDDIVNTPRPGLLAGLDAPAYFPALRGVLVASCGQRANKWCSWRTATLTASADDVIACGARGVVSEPYTDYKALARRHPDAFLAGEGDNRVLKRNRPDEIDAMVRAHGRDRENEPRLSAVHRQPHSVGHSRRSGQALPWTAPRNGAGGSKAHEHRTFNSERPTFNLVGCSILNIGRS